MRTSPPIQRTRDIVGSFSMEVGVQLAASEPSGAYATNSLWVNGDTVYIWDGDEWRETLTLAGTPGDVLMGTASPATGAGVPANEGDVYFRPMTSTFQVWVKGAGGDTDWTNANTPISYV